MRTRRSNSNTREGFALVTVVLVLAALLLLCTPFLLSARNADQASQQLFNRAQAQIALDNASTHARAVLERSHPAFDTTRYADAQDELRVLSRFADGFLDARDAEGVMWDVTTTDVAGQIDLASAPPQVIGAILGSVSRLVEPLEADEKGEIPLATVDGLDPSGYVWIGGELIRYSGIDGNTLTGIERGVGALYDAEDNALPGPLPPTSHGLGTNVIDQRAYAPVEWRAIAGDVRTFDSYEQLSEVNQYAPPEQPLGPHHFESMARLGTVYGHVGQGGPWQRPARMISSAEAGVDGEIRVDSVRWFNIGSTIQIKASGSTELAIIRNVSGNGTLFLDRSLTFSYEAYDAEVRVLARRPVNINTASSAVLTVLLENLKVRGRNSRITGGEAKALASLIIESRPFEGVEDFMRRIVLPAAGIEPLPGDAPIIPDAFAGGDATSSAGGSVGGVIDGWDAVALYRNALNANDYGLEYSTMPFCFTTNDVYDLSLRAVINAPSGVERYAAAREETLAVIPQEELTHIWTTQEDWDEMLRNKREAPFWATGPESTSRHDGAGSQPPSRMWAHLGTHEGGVFLPGVVNNTGMTFSGDQPNPQHVFADRDSATGYAQLFHTEVDESADPELQGRMLHFRHETRDLEGRYLPDETVTYPPDNERVQWDVQPSTGLVRGFHFSCWVKPTSLADGILLDVGGASQDADRVSLLFESGDLVLRYLDGGGDHIDTQGFSEATEVRYALGQSDDSPGLPVDIWSHIEVDVRGSRPDQMALFVNGLAPDRAVRTLGLTRLQGALSENQNAIAVESTEGFPPRGVVRIGNELIEYTLSGPNSLDANYIATGPDAGFGGRNARTRWSGGDPPVPQNLGAIDLNHPDGAPVELYGYAQTLAANTTSGQGTLQSDLGQFRVGVVTALEGGSQSGQAISVLGLFGGFILGNGIKPGDTNITGLVLGSAEQPDNPGADIPGVMQAFSQQGGYAALLQARAGEDVDGNQIGGWSVIRYSGWTGNTLQVSAWGDGVTELTNLNGVDYEDGGGARSFIVEWQALLGGVPVQQIHEARLFVVPISVAVNGNSGAFLPATLQQPQFAQITELGAGETTEWVAYNSVQSGAGTQLVRDDPIALENAHLVVVRARVVEPDDPTQQSFGPPGAPLDPPPSPPLAGPGPATPAAPIGPQWQPILGELQDADFPISRGVREALQHRGVLGTFSHPHAAASLVVPVFRAQERGVDGGRPGRFDPVFLMESDFSHLGWPMTVYRGHQSSFNVLVHQWDPTPNDMVAVDAGTSFSLASVDQTGDWLFTFDRTAPAPVQAGTVSGGGNANVADTRAIGRLLRWPSGERARGVTTVTVGGGFDGGGIPSAFVDEVAFGATEFGMSTPLVDPESMQAGQLVLRDDFPSPQGQNILFVWPQTNRVPLGAYGSTHTYLSDLDSDGGLIRIGTEILAYESYDAQQGELTIAPNGRGLLGTAVGTYEIGNTATFLDGFRVGILSTGMGAGDSQIELTSSADFPSQGTVLIGSELLHYTRLRGNVLEMPRLSTTAGANDQRGGGVFRGRYGSVGGAHSAGEPVILFPMRYWDRWEAQADGPELSYFGIEVSQPSTFWKSFAWEEEAVGLGGVDLGILMRSDPDVPWDADPELTDGLDVFYQSQDSGEIQKWIGTQTDRIEWRVFVEYTNGAFDPDTGFGHAWRTTPRLRSLLVDYIGPNVTLRRIDR